MNVPSLLGTCHAFNHPTYQNEVLIYPQQDTVDARGAILGRWRAQCREYHKIKRSANIFFSMVKRMQLKTCTWRVFAPFNMVLAHNWYRTLCATYLPCMGVSAPPILLLIHKKLAKPIVVTTPIALLFN